MMIQSAPQGQPRFISTMVEHNDLCRQFAEAFGNDAFERPEPFEEMVYVIGHHDRGWDDWDASPELDPGSGLPCGLGTAPVKGSVATSSRSPDFNEKHHAFCGLLSSMHSWGPYNERYGFTDFRVRPGGSTSVPIAPKLAQETNAMLDGEQERQARIKAALAADPETRGWVEEAHLMQNYKLLQFCDTLALYFNLRHSSEHREETYIHVPRNGAQDASITLTPLGDGVYSLSPFPFAGERLEAACGGRYVEPFADGDALGDLGTALAALPTDTQIHTLVAG